MIETVQEILQIALLGCGVFMCEKAFKVSQPMSGCLVQGAAESSEVFPRNGQFSIISSWVCNRVFSWKKQQMSCFEQTEMAFLSPHQNEIVVATLKAYRYKNTMED